MSTGYKIDEKDGIYFLTFQIVEWVDIFTRKIYRDLVLESLNYCMQSKGLIILIWLILIVVLAKVFYGIYFDNSVENP